MSIMCIASNIRPPTIMGGFASVY